MGNIGKQPLISELSEHLSDEFIVSITSFKSCRIEHKSTHSFFFLNGCGSGGRVRPVLIQSLETKVSLGKIMKPELLPMHSSETEC